MMAGRYACAKVERELHNLLTDRRNTRDGSEGVADMDVGGMAQAGVPATPPPDRQPAVRARLDLMNTSAVTMEALHLQLYNQFENLGVVICIKMLDEISRIVNGYASAIPTLPPGPRSLWKTNWLHNYKTN